MMAANMKSVALLWALAALIIGASTAAARPSYLRHNVALRRSGVPHMRFAETVAQARASAKAMLSRVSAIQSKLLTEEACELYNTCHSGTREVPQLSSNARPFAASQAGSQVPQSEARQVASLSPQVRSFARNGQTAPNAHLFPDNPATRNAVNPMTAVEADIARFQSLRRATPEVVGPSTAMSAPPSAAVAPSQPVAAASTTTTTAAASSSSDMITLHVNANGETAPVALSDSAAAPSTVAAPPVAASVASSPVAAVVPAQQQQPAAAAPALPFNPNVMVPVDPRSIVIDDQPAPAAAAAAAAPAAAAAAAQPAAAASPSPAAAATPASAAQLPRFRQRQHMQARRSRRVARSRTRAHRGPCDTCNDELEQEDDMDGSSTDPLDSISPEGAAQAQQEIEDLIQDVKGEKLGRGRSLSDARTLSQMDKQLQRDEAAVKALEVDKKHLIGDVQGTQLYVYPSVLVKGSEAAATEEKDDKLNQLRPTSCKDAPGGCVELPSVPYDPHKLAVLPDGRSVEMYPVVVVHANKPSPLADQ